jgi:hypothetical protein
MPPCDPQAQADGGAVRKLLNLNLKSRPTRCARQCDIVACIQDHLSNLSCSPRPRPLWIVQVKFLIMIKLSLSLSLSLSLVITIQNDWPFNFPEVQTGLPRELAQLLTRATQQGLVSPGGGDQAQLYHPASPPIKLSPVTSSVCVYYCSTYYKAVRVGGGG